MPDDRPEHYPIDVNADGEGPASPDEAVATVCWCGMPGCERYKTERTEAP